MRTTAQPTRLLPLQTRLIHASAGMRLRVVSGRLWLTQPNVAQDLFLRPGEVVDLMQDWVVIGADAEPRSPHQDRYSEYLVVPLGEPVPRWHSAAALAGWARRLGQRLRVATPWGRARLNA